MVLACREHALQLSEAAFEIDVDMGANMAGAARDAFADQIAGVLRSRAASAAGSSCRSRFGSSACAHRMPDRMFVLLFGSFGP
jgi:hypothetical protein